LDEGRIVKLVNLIQEDFTNYKKPSLFLGFPYCTGKCNLYKIVCQNEELRNAMQVEISIQEIINLYTKNNITKAIVCGGLEPLDSFNDLLEFIKEFRKISEDDIVIYTGYYKEETPSLLLIEKLKENNIQNIIIKFGRYVEGDNRHFDPVLGVELASNNQYAEKVL